MSDELDMYGVLMHAARMMAKDPIRTTRMDAQAMVRRFEATPRTVLAVSEYKRFVTVLIAAAGSDRTVSERFDEVTDSMTPLILPGLDELRLLDDESGDQIFPGSAVLLFPERGSESQSPATFLGIQITRTGQVMVEVEDGEGPGRFFQHRISGHVVDKAGRQVHKVDIGR